MVPNSDHYITCGEDFLLAKWDITKRKQLKRIELKYQAKTVHVSEDAKLVAVGCTNGYVIIYDIELNEKTIIKDRKKEISEVKFSPNNEYLAVGAHDSRIFVYSVNQNWK